jgi:hypothetical protein
VIANKFIKINGIAPIFTAILGIESKPEPKQQLKKVKETVNHIILVLIFFSITNWSEYFIEMSIIYIINKS